jgi:hypothetical protein
MTLGKPDLLDQGQSWARRMLGGEHHMLGRTQRIGWTWVAAILLAVAHLSAEGDRLIAGNAGDTPNRPNVVFIIADDK